MRRSEQKEILLAGLVLLAVTLVMLGVRLPWTPAAAPAPFDKRSAEPSGRSDTPSGHAA